MSVRGDVRPRVYCPRCSRSIAVTFDARGGVYLRSHFESDRKRCASSGRDVRTLPTHYPPRRTKPTP